MDNAFEQWFASFSRSLPFSSNIFRGCFIMNVQELRVIYLANARLPTEKAHGYQICKMCEAFALNGAEVVLLHPW
jgi:hypothetical protein